MRPGFRPGVFERLYDTIRVFRNGASVKHLRERKNPKLGVDNHPARVYNNLRQLRRPPRRAAEYSGDLHSGSAADSDSVCGSSILSSPTKPQRPLAAGFSGHSAAGSAPGSGLGGRGFKSRCSDQRNYPHGCLKNQAFMRVFLFVFVLYGPRRTPAKRPEARLNGLQKMGGQPAKTPPRRHQSAGRGTFYVPDRPGRVSRDRGNSGRLEGLPGRGVIRPIKQIKEKSEPVSHRKKARLFCKRKTGQPKLSGWCG